MGEIAFGRADLQPVDNLGTTLRLGIVRDDRSLILDVICGAGVGYFEQLLGRFLRLPTDREGDFADIIAGKSIKTIDP